jgi:hypothetical protein
MVKKTYPWSILQQLIHVYVLETIQFNQENMVKKQSVHLRMLEANRTDLYQAKKTWH